MVLSRDIHSCFPFLFLLHSFPLKVEVIFALLSLPCLERFGCRWQFIVANRQSRGFTPQVNEWLSTVISPNTDYQMFFKERHWNTYEAILTGPCRICNAIMPLSNKTN